METDEAVRQLKQLKVWVAVGAIGFLLIGAAAITFAVSTASVMAAMDKEFRKDNGCEV